ncbi:hypothetical protein BDV37DRAFT_251630 [Aspergillus pseudonomiae]|uniref:Uncharacterized protein n=1 Tax=Aspergillus pseudonomiae TaxID=1506151 RepID=A0A5N7D960_9EURO|nr:uncharacterized protein BDV37DRAFT_251630 [Aspergillus pseudonomiae]KAE8402971.1 hypothetical protein BDV37DRAFT_251630 [Aspergillus pseudonomiae]
MGVCYLDSTLYGIRTNDRSGGAFRRGDCYGCTLIPEPHDIAVRRHDVRCTCRTNTQNPVTGAYVTQTTFPIGILPTDSIQDCLLTGVLQDISLMKMVI